MKIFKDTLHSTVEERFIILGKTKKNRLLYAVFTKRKNKQNLPSDELKQSLFLRNKIRIISGRDINKKELKIPKFKNEDEEREFWAKVDLSEYFEPSDFERVSFPNLKPTTLLPLPLPKWV